MHQFSFYITCYDQFSFYMYKNPLTKKGNKIKNKSKVLTLSFFCASFLIFLSLFFLRELSFVFLFENITRRDAFKSNRTFPHKVQTLETKHIEILKSLESINIHEWHESLKSCFPPIVYNIFGYIITSQFGLFIFVVLQLVQFYVLFWMRFSIFQNVNFNKLLVITFTSIIDFLTSFETHLHKIKIEKKREQQ